MWVRSNVLMATVGVMVSACLQPPPVALASTPPIMLGVHTRGESLTLLTAMNQWESKTNAFADTEQPWRPEATTGLSGAQDQQTTFATLTNIWSAGSIPQLTWYPTVGAPGDDLTIAGGSRDRYVVSFCSALRGWLAGPDGTYNTSDDRRLLLRFAPEANGNWHQYSPIWHAPGTNPPDATTEKRFALGFVAMWQHVHGVFTTAGLDSAHVAWVFAVANQDSYYAAADGSPVPIVEQIYPGDGATDWVGVDGYNRGGLGINPNDRWISPGDVFNPMLSRLRALSTKPAAVSEVGTTRIQDDGTASDAAKSQWLTDYGTWVSQSGVRMAMYWDDDVSDGPIKPDFPVFGGTVGPDSYASGGQTYLAYNAYAAVVGAAPFVGADSANPRIVTDSVFLGA